MLRSAERGLLKEEEIVELADGNTFSQCHFYSCDFVGTGNAYFRHCNFELCRFFVNSTLEMTIVECYIRECEIVPN